MKQLLNKRIHIYFITFILLCFCSFSSVRAEIFGCTTVTEIQNALSTAAGNRQNDIICILPGEYLIDSPLIYEPAATENHALFIGGLPIPTKPVLNGQEANQILVIDHDPLFGPDGAGDSRARVTIADLAFINGSAREHDEESRSSGALSIQTHDADIKIVSCLFENNKAENGIGAGAYLSKFKGGRIDLINNVFTRNTNESGDGGGLGMYFDEPCLIQIINNTFLDNYAETLGTGASLNYSRMEGDGPDPDMILRVYNNIFFNTIYPYGLDVHIFDLSNSITHEVYNNRIDHYDVNLGPLPLDASNWNLDPVLNPDFTLDSASPCIDSGSHHIGYPFEFPILAYYINYRVQDGDLDGTYLVDRGATEFKTSDEYHRPEYYRFVPDDGQDNQSPADGHPHFLTIGNRVKNSHKTVGWTLSSQRDFTDGYSLYYGNPKTSDYDTGKTGNKGVVLIEDIDLGKRKHPRLSFMLYMDTERGDHRDVLNIYANGKLIWKKDKFNVSMKKWQLVEVGLEKLAGQTIDLHFEFDTIDARKNSLEGVYINELMIQ